ncbi:energy transducer TonB family protein [Acinetobacter oleivorans]|uniref:energy transducer TonB family protein n=1 Tax=Acinetobacter oleivorans TaxID=1148157 RepID=UPI00157FF410|nr:energy transducer TonB [Acinetobacter oleivorans]NUG02407.1 TonB family protein [Acinetobacter oleivorans]
MKFLLLGFVLMLCGNTFANNKTSNPQNGILWKNAPYIDGHNLLKGKPTSITVEVESDETGKVISVHVIKSSQILALDSYVVNAYKNASFYPFLENGEYFPIRIQQTVDFIKEENDSFKNKLIKFLK